MAEGLLRRMAGDRFEACSAGIDPTGEVHPCAVEAMSEVGMDISDQYPKGLKTYMGRMGFNYLIIVCARAGERCPSFVGDAAGRDECHHSRTRRRMELRAIGCAKGAIVYARVINLRFPPAMKTEVVSVAQGLEPVLKERPGFNGLDVVTNPRAGDGVIVSFWQTEADAEASESSASYIGQMSMMSSFLYGPVTPTTYEANVRV